jgi:alpha-L-fucosidase
VVREIADACRRHGLRFGVYLSPWDRNHPSYGTPAYLDVYRAQLRELLTGYGPIFEVWHDGANGGDGYYGGAREKRTIDRRTYYDWPATWALVRQLQPEAVIFSDVGPDVRWVGNEKGIAPETSWATFAPVGEDGGVAAPGYVKTEESGTGHRSASQWLPPECDVSIRPGWFWHEKENGRVKTPDQLMELYFQSVGRGCNLLLNVPPDRRGLLHESDIAALEAFGDRLRRTFATDLARSAAVTAAHGEGAAAVADGRRDTHWLSPGATSSSIVLALKNPAAVGIVRLREHIALGQRIDAFAIDAWVDGDWREVAQGTSVGPTRLVRLAAPAETSRVRVRITKASAPPALAEVGLFGAP